MSKGRKEIETIFDFSYWYTKQKFFYRARQKKHTKREGVGASAAATAAASLFGVSSSSRMFLVKSPFLGSLFVARTSSRVMSMDESPFLLPDF